MFWHSASLSLHCKLKNRTIMKPKKKLFFMECHVAGRQYHEASEVWDKLKIGTELKLEFEKDNRYDPNAVAIIFYDKDEEEEYLLGYVPRTDNKTLAMFLDMGYENIFECRISQIDSEENYEEQLHVTIKIKRNQECG